MSKQSVEQAFYVDEFFADDEAEPLVVEVEVRGRKVPILVKRTGITNADRLAAEMAALQVERLEDGRARVKGIDESRASLELIARNIVSWPFIDRETKEPLPVNAANVGRMLGGAETLLTTLEAISKQRDEALAPFEPPSVAG